MLFGRLFRIFLELARHFLNTHFAHMIIIVIRILSCIHLFLVRLNKCNTLRDQTIVTVYVQLDSFLANLFNTLDKPIRVSVRVVINNPHPTINLSDLFPMRHLPRTVVFDSLKLVRITIFSLKLVTSMLVKVTHFLYLDLFVVLKLFDFLPRTECTSLPNHRADCNQHISQS